MSLKATVGAGALVFKDDSILLVQLNYGKVKGQWILPGGLLEVGEDPASAACRELKEETNQDGEVITLHCVRYRSEPSDIYWVFKIRLNNTKPINFPREEIIDARYWPISEALAATEVRPMTKYFIQTSLEGNPNEVQFPKDHLQKDKVYFMNY